jgi:oxygen-independent coproporphyrinogen-3 oxidase
VSALDGGPAAGGIYVHFPFCVHRCFYCDFNVFTPPRVPHREYADAVIAELAARAPGLAVPARSLYFGGGTPSLWEPAEIARVVAAARRAPGLTAGAEITLEANPVEVTPTLLGALREAGINRLSLGVQALHDELLAKVDRRHDAAQALAAIEAVRGAGFVSWTIDLMFGLPGQTPASWEADLERFLGLDVPHASIYALTVEPKTPLALLVRKGRVALPGEDPQTDMLLATRRVLTAAGYEHYEVSSYARPGHRSVHNSGYWDMTPFLGLGAGAHGFVSPTRWRNLRRVGPYVAAAMGGGLPTHEEEHLDAPTLAFEHVMTGLRRLVEGVDLAEHWERYGATVAQQVGVGALERLSATRVRLTERGLRYMNDVLLAFCP